VATSCPSTVTRATRNNISVAAQIINGHFVNQAHSSKIKANLSHSFGNPYVNVVIPGDFKFGSATHLFSTYVSPGLKTFGVQFKILFTLVVAGVGSGKNCSAKHYKILSPLR
jgi:hypothetical protein